MSERITEHFYWEEVIASEQASRLDINNTLPDALKTTVRRTAEGMERARMTLRGKPINVSSWYRCPLLNTAIGSKATSQHVKGEAVDFVCRGFGSAYDVALALANDFLFVKFDQLIYEHTWVHISFCSGDPQRKPRGNILTLAADGKSYIPGVVKK